MFVVPPQVRHGAQARPPRPSRAAIEERALVLHRAARPQRAHPNVTEHRMGHPATTSPLGITRLHVVDPGPEISCTSGNASARWKQPGLERPQASALLPRVSFRKRSPVESPFCRQCFHQRLEAGLHRRCAAGSRTPRLKISRRDPVLELRRGPVVAARAIGRRGRRAGRAASGGPDQHPVEVALVVGEVDALPRPSAGAPYQCPCAHGDQASDRRKRRRPPASGQCHSVPEMDGTPREHPSRLPPFVRRRDHFVVAHRAARLDHAAWRRAIDHHGSSPSRNGEEPRRLATARGPVAKSPRIAGLGCLPMRGRVEPGLHLPGADTERHGPPPQETPIALPLHVLSRTLPCEQQDRRVAARSVCFAVTILRSGACHLMVVRALWISRPEPTRFGRSPCMLRPCAHARGSTCRWTRAGKCRSAARAVLGLRGEQPQKPRRGVKARRPSAPRLKLLGHQAAGQFAASELAVERDDPAERRMSGSVLERLPP